MLDIRQIASDPEAWAARLAGRGAAQLQVALELDTRRRALIQRADQLRHEKSQTEKGMRSADKKGPEFATFRDRMRSVGAEIGAAAKDLKSVEAELADLMLRIPNAPETDTPVGAGEADNVEVRRWGTKPSFDFEPLPHDELGAVKPLLDFTRAAKITGARCSLLKGPLARLERALMAFMLDLHSEEHGYTEVLTPYLVNTASMQGTGQYPKFRDDAFEIEADGLVLVPTAEVSITNLHRDEILAADELPLRYTGFTPCFRREAGGYGRDTRGLIRLHQFQKVELVHITRPEESAAALHALTAHAEKVLQRLELHYRVVDLCTGDLGFGAQRTYDLEVWLPGQDAYREISSCSNCGDFQARRARIRYRAEGQKKPQLVHTLNGSGLAIGRTMVAVLENGQRADGSIALPEALWRYMGVDTIEPAGD